MRTISKNLKLRLLAQAEEASFRSLDKVASKLIQQVKASPTRSMEEEYIYSRSELQSDVEDLLWKAALRTQDYFGKTCDAAEVGELVESLAADFVDSMRTKLGGVVIGPNEPLVPGEQRLIVEIEEDE
jgi:hypothetical protein